MDHLPDLEDRLNFLGKELIRKIVQSAIFKKIPANTEILNSGKYVSSVPIVLDGIVKVFTRHEDKELLLYYIRPRESCIMSLISAIKNRPSQVWATTETDTSIVLLPSDKMDKWMKAHPSLYMLFINQFHLRYSDMLETIQQILFHNLEERVLNYLVARKNMSPDPELNLTHQKIATDLGTAREVVSRIIKKLENEKKLIQTAKGIKFPGQL